MDRLSQYQLQLKTLSVGNHHYEFDLDNQFFADVEGPEITAGEVKAEIEVNKTSLNIELNITLQGKVETICDRCLDALWVDIDVEESLYIKFGKAYSEESIEELLRECGFELLAKFGDDTFSPPACNSQRIVYAARCVNSGQIL